MTSAPAHTRQANSASIDRLAKEVDGLKQQLASGAKLTSRELRDIWSKRLRSFWRLQVEIYRRLSRRFLDLGENYLAAEVTEEGSEFFGDDIPLILTRTLAIARSGAPKAAQELLRRKEAVLEADEARSLLARTYKDLWKASGNEEYLREAFDFYHQDYQTTKGDRSFPGVNAASMALLAGEKEQARRIAGEVVEIIRARPGELGYWDQASLAECLLIEGEIEAARQAYRKATSSGDIPHAHLATTRAQARLLLKQHGVDSGAFDPCFPLPGVIAFSGHRTDAADRAQPRFPEAQADEVKTAIATAIQKGEAGFGYAAAASGADILFLEAMQEAGLETFILLPLPEKEFIEQSVAPHWLERYQAVTSRATEFTCSTSGSSLAFDYGNRLLFGAASRHAQQLGSDVRLLAVWDGRPGDGGGGTADYVAMVQSAGRPVDVIPLGPAAAATPAHPITASSSSANEMLLHVVCFAPGKDEVAQRIAETIAEGEIVHREGAGPMVRLFYRRIEAAIEAALVVSQKFGVSLGLHSGPIRLVENPLSGGKVSRGEHATKGDLLANLQPAGLTYASGASSSLLALTPLTGVRCEFLGYRSLRPGAAREPIFRLAS